MHKKAYGFTIVELLIVIIIIGILAAISTIAYTNFQQRAKNTAIINAANQSLKALQAYIAMEGAYPSKSWACVTSESGCHTNGAVQSVNSTFDAQMAQTGTLPKSIPTEGAKNYGVTYVYYSLIVFNGESRPAHLRYFLFGKDQQCGMPGVMQSTGVVDTFVTSSTGYTSYDNSTGKTTCYISVPGPAHKV